MAKNDQELIQIVDAALADAVQRSGEWLACKSGCSQCCVGVFSISQLDAKRLREGLLQLEPEKAARVRERVAFALEILREKFPGDFASGTLDEDDPRFEDFGNEVVCPVLDPETRTCDLYAARPMTCRTFGPPVRNAEGIGTCELCFVGATEEQITAAVMDASFLNDEERLNSTLGSGTTIVALALRDL
ncbi:MAG: YkgJ family cysteine cluster protein [Acidobacteria bacterium]|nr:YkgJ family cysteine cluster protein [Acidobacteriota bacterium]